MEDTRVSGLAVGDRGGRLRRLAILAAGVLCIPPQAKAAIYFWEDSPPAVAQPAPRTPPARQAKSPRHGDKKPHAVVEKETKPQGPLIISISIAQQKLRLYDANGLFAESPVSTGMPGHPTPMGVFSIIQKQKFHRSNIYSGAPMPFMQRITWSGVAMHAGVLPGHPASHGCIRMPMAFAVKMYGWTKMGARVIVTPGDVTPASFSHPLLATTKVLPQPVTMQETKTDVAAVQTLEKPIPVSASKLPEVTEAKIELRSSVGHVDSTETPRDESRPSPALKTADASGALPAVLRSNRTTDVAPVNEAAQQPSEATVSDHRETSKATSETDAAKSEIEPNAAKGDEATASGEKPAGETSAEAAPADTADGDIKPVEKASDTPAAPAASGSPDRAIGTVGEAETPKPTSVDAEKTAATAPAAAAAAPTAATETPLKDDLKSDFAKSAAPKADPGFAFQGSGQIAVFVSRKDSKLYIRQNFAPLFQIPVTISADARPLGTHIFTAQVDGNDHNALRWSVVSLPSPARSSERHTQEQRGAHGHKFAAAPVEVKPQPATDSPAEALDRLALPANVMAKIYEAVATGGSIIVSDQGIAAGETGEGTDFIVSLR